MKAKEETINKVTTEACAACKAHCCRHIAMPLDKPTSKRDYDNIRWYLMHKNVHVYIEFDNSWMIEFRTPCLNLNDKFQCGNYENRPNICREFPPVDEACEFFTDESPYKKMFMNVHDFETYLDQKKIDWRFKYKSNSKVCKN